MYAYQAEDAALMAQATEVRKRAERRLGELMKEEAEAGKLAKGTKGNFATDKEAAGQAGGTTSSVNRSSGLLVPRINPVETWV
jgi:hypothetical protein